MSGFCFSSAAHHRPRLPCVRQASRWALPGQSEGVDGSILRIGRTAAEGARRRLQPSRSTALAAKGPDCIPGIGPTKGLGYSFRGPHDVTLSVVVGSAILQSSTVVQFMGEALARGDGAYFLGSGISGPSGLPGWDKLVGDLAEPLGLKLRKGDDLPLMAQHCVNADAGNRGPLTQRLRRSLTRKHAVENRYHRAISRTNIRTIWTTNFDVLLENALSATRVRVRSNDSDLTSGLDEFDVEVLKVHGCLERSAADELVLTREDYDDFEIRRPALAARLRHDLLNRSFLFAGYSYRDPDIHTVLIEARRLSKRATREHYLIVPRESEPDEQRRQELWLQDLRRVGIKASLTAKHQELESVLDSLALRSRGRSVFVTGGRDNADGRKIAGELGAIFARDADLVLLDGQSEGIGHAAAAAFGAACVRGRIDVRERLRHFPNPYSFNPEFSDNQTLLPMLRLWRASLLRAAHTVVAFDGGIGTGAELDVAKELGCKVIPVPLDKDGSSMRLLNDSVVQDALDQEYVSSARALTLTPEMIAKAVIRSFST